MEILTSYLKENCKGDKQKIFFPLHLELAVVHSETTYHIEKSKFDVAICNRQEKPLKKVFGYKLFQNKNYMLLNERVLKVESHTVFYKNLF